MRAAVIAKYCYIDTRQRQFVRRCTLLDQYSMATRNPLAKFVCRLNRCVVDGDSNGPVVTDTSPRGRICQAQPQMWWSNTECTVFSTSDQHLSNSLPSSALPRSFFYFQKPIPIWPIVGTLFLRTRHWHSCHQHCSIAHTFSQRATSDNSLDPSVGPCGPELK